MTKEDRILYHREYYHRTKERDKEKRAKWAKENRDKVLINQRDWRLRNRNKIKEQSAAYAPIAKIARKFTLNGRWWSYISDARKRKIGFLLTKDEFKSLWGKPCHYCGSEIATIGVDRIDSCGPYRIGNIRPCCHRCNMMKNSHSSEDFVNHCIKVATHFELATGEKEA